MLLGEQPGDVEDREGEPFVGPAGRLLRELLAEIGIPEDGVFLTNAVKHFKWEPRGKRRIHEPPNRSEVKACSLWLERELEIVRPTVIVCLGAVAAQAVVGPGARVTALRRRPLPDGPGGATIVVTYHPSAVLRAGERRSEVRADLRYDLAHARKLAAKPIGRSEPAAQEGA
jgi:DNA polymerase